MPVKRQAPRDEPTAPGTTATPPHTPSLADQQIELMTLEMNYLRAELQSKNELLDGASGKTTLGWMACSQVLCFRCRFAKNLD